MNNEILVQEFEPVVKQSGLDKAEQYAAIFAPFMITLKELSNKAETINKDNPSVLDAKLAREVRLAMAKNRTASEKQKDTSKAALLAEGSLIQNLYNIVASASKLSEADLDNIEKFAEKKEAARIEAIRLERIELLSPYVEDANIFPLGTMSADQFDTMLNGYKLAHQQAKEAAEKAEAERLAKEAAEKLEQERIRLENEQLKKEAEAKEKALQAERQAAKKEADKAAAEQARIAKENADKLAKIEAANKAARDKAAAELKAAQDAAAKAQRDLQAKKDAEAKAAADKLEAEKKAAKAPDKEKLKVWIYKSDIGSIPIVEGTEMYRKALEIAQKFDAYKSWALQQIEQL